jgi:DNA-binding NtrC family response regulator
MSESLARPLETILVVDDMEMVLELVVEILKSAKFHVLQAGSGANYGWAFIEKPFVPVKLLEMVNVVLHTPDKSQGGRQYDTRGDTGKPEEGQTPKDTK